MFDLERWQELLETLWKNRLRTFLTGLAVSSGIFILVILLGFGKGLENGIEYEFEQDSSTSLWVWPETTSVAYDGLNPGRRIRFSLEEFQDLKKAFGSEYEYGSPRMFVGGVSAVYGNEALPYSIQAVNDEFQFIENAGIGEGRFLNKLDLEERNKVIVIGRKLRDEVFEQGQSPIGEYIELSGIPFMVVGVYEEMNEGEEQRMYVPITTAEVVFADFNQVGNYAFSLYEKENLDETLANTAYVKEILFDYLKKKHRVAPEDDRAIFIWSMAEETERYYNLINNISLFNWFVGICTLIAGIVGVGNIMLIVVKERTRELGIRKALGATPTSLIGLILHEALFITIVSGSIGFVTSMGLLEIFGADLAIDYLRYPAVDFRIATAMVLVLVVAGTIAGLVPAMKAAKTRVVVALKEE